VKDGYRAASGVVLGDPVLMAGSALGVASLLQAYPPLFMVVKYVGAAYLFYIGVGLVRASTKRRRGAPAAEDATPEPATAPRPFRRALMVSPLNPKAILFFISFFIQIVNRPVPAR
jgi:leucine efflux protein